MQQVMDGWFTSRLTSLLGVEIARDEGLQTGMARTSFSDFRLPAFATFTSFQPFALPVASRWVGTRGS